MAGKTSLVIIKVKKVIANVLHSTNVDSTLFDFGSIGFEVPFLFLVDDDRVPSSFSLAVSCIELESV